MTWQPAKTMDRFVDQGTDLQQIQLDLLAGILDSNAETAYGRQHRFHEVDGWAPYASRPLMTYDEVDGPSDFWNTPENFTAERLAAYFLTSGSSSTPKRIPVTGSLIRQKATAFSVFWDGIYAAHPGIQTGRIIANFGDSGVVSRRRGQVVELSETTFWNQRMQGFQNSDRWPIPRQLTALGSAEHRYYGAARLALQGGLHCMMSLNPSTLLRFCQTLVEHREALEDGLRQGTWGLPDLDGRKDLPDALTARLRSSTEAAGRLATFGERRPGLSRLWSDLSLVICWQSDLVRPYLDELRGFTEDTPLRDYITQSSECVMAIPYRDNVSGGLLAYQSHFFEFIEEDAVDSAAPETVPAWELRDGDRYEVVVTTGAGLYRYRMNDCVRVLGHENGIPILEFQYRFGRTSSMTGEKLTERQVMEALGRTPLEGLLAGQDVMVIPRAEGMPHYAIVVDQGDLREGAMPVEMSDWLRRFHEALAEINGEYRSKCASLRLGRPKMLIVPKGSIRERRTRERAQHVGDDQYKPAVLRRDRSLAGELEILSVVHADSED